MYTCPSALSSKAFFASLIGTLCRFCQTTIRRTLFFLAASSIRRVSSSVRAIGFSTRTCFPASAASTAIVERATRAGCRC